MRGHLHKNVLCEMWRDLIRNESARLDPCLQTTHAYSKSLGVKTQPSIKEGCQFSFSSDLFYYKMPARRDWLNYAETVLLVKSRLCFLFASWASYLLQGCWILHCFVVKREFKTEQNILLSMGRAIWNHSTSQLQLIHSNIYRLC